MGDNDGDGGEGGEGGDDNRDADAGKKCTPRKDGLGERGWEDPTQRWIAVDGGNGKKKPYFFDPVAGEVAWRLPAPPRGFLTHGAPVPQCIVSGATVSRVNGKYRQCRERSDWYIHDDEPTISIRSARGKTCWVISEGGVTAECAERNVNGTTSDNEHDSGGGKTLERGVERRLSVLSKRRGNHLGGVGGSTSAGDGGKVKGKRKGKKHGPTIHYRCSERTPLPPCFGWEDADAKRSKAAAPVASVEPHRYSMEQEEMLDAYHVPVLELAYAVSVHFLPTFLTLQSALIASTLVKAPDLLDHVLGAASITELLKLELVRLEKTFDSGMNRPIWTILSQIAFAPKGLSSNELCSVAGIHAGKQSLAWAVLSQCLDNLLHERLGKWEFRSPAIIEAVTSWFLRRPGQYWATASIQHALLDTLVDERAEELDTHGPRFARAGMLALDGSPTTELNKANEGLDDDDVIFLASGLLHNSAIATLNLRHNIIGDKGASYLGGVLQNNSTLTHLLLDGNRIGGAGATRLFVSISMNFHTGLRRVTLKGNGIRCSGAKAVAEAIESGAGIEYLDLSNNKIASNGGKALADALKDPAASLKVLKLDENQIRDRGAVAFGHALVKNKQLQELLLASNAIKGDGATALGDGLCTNKTLKVLGLRRNKIDENGAGGIASGLLDNSTLEELDLWTNVLSDQGLCALARALLANRGLKKLDIRSNGLIGYEGVKAINHAQASNSVINIIYDSKFGPKVAAAIPIGF